MTRRVFHSNVKRYLTPFAKRTEWDLGLNRLAQAREELRRQGAEVLDLTESNPTRAGLACPPELLAPLSAPDSLQYDPDPQGLLSARQAVASLYAGKGANVPPEQILLTAGTSEAYGFLFRLLADAGDAVLIPRPSYPLFGYLADLNDVRTVPYSLRPEKNRWAVDFESLQAAFTSRTRAVVAVHPNNPTGSCLRLAEWEGLLDLCRRNGAALIADEVFAEYLCREDPEVPATLWGGAGVLTFALGGLSKLLGLPQMKLAWIACSGPAEELRPALEKLELIADTVLTVNTPVQRAFPEWVRQAAAFQGPIRHRVGQNRRFLEEQAARPGSPFYLPPSDGGWSAALHFPSVKDGEKWATGLLESRRVLVHPGYLFEFEGEGWIAVSLLPPPDVFEEGIRRLSGSS